MLKNLEGNDGVKFGIRERKSPAVIEVVRLLVLSVSGAIQFKADIFRASEELFVGFLSAPDVQESPLNVGGERTDVAI